MSRRRPLTPQQFADIREAAKRGPVGKPLEEMVRGTIAGTATVPEPVLQPTSEREELSRKHPTRNNAQEYVHKGGLHADDAGLDQPAPLHPDRRAPTR